MRRIIIADINSWNVNGVSNGHYVPVARNLCDVFAADDTCVFVAGGPVFAKSFDEKSLIHLPYDVKPGDSSVRRKWKNLANLWALRKQLKKGDVVVYQASAVAAVYLGLLLMAKRNVRRYLIQYSPIESLSSLLKRFLWRMAKGKFAGLICTSEEICQSFGIKGCVVPDYIATKRAVDVAHEPKFDFSFVGTITEKKGVVEGVRLLAEKGCRVLVAGRALNQKDEKALEEIGRTYAHVTLKLGYLGAADFDAAIKDAAMTVLNYTNAYSSQSSGIVYDSIFRLRPVLGRRCTALSFIEENGIGALYEDLATVDVQKELDSARQNTYRQNIRKYFEQHVEFARKLNAFVKSEGET